MKIGVMSDTHGNIEAMQRAADIMTEAFGVEAIIHLGDDMEDTKGLNCNGAELFAVPGIYEPSWRDKNVPHRLIREFGGVVFLLSHTTKMEKGDSKDDIDPETAAQKHRVQVLLHGHTHIPQASVSNDGMIVVNPGHLKNGVDRGLEATFAIVSIENGRLDVNFYDLNGIFTDSARFEVSDIFS